MSTVVKKDIHPYVLEKYSPNYVRKDHDENAYIIATGFFKKTYVHFLWTWKSHPKQIDSTLLNGLRQYVHPTFPAQTSDAEKYNQFFQS